MAQLPSTKNGTLQSDVDIPGERDRRYGPPPPKRLDDDDDDEDEYFFLFSDAEHCRHFCDCLLFENSIAKI